MEFRINHFQKFCGAPTKLESKQQPSFPHIDQRSQLIPNAISGTSGNQSNTPTIVCDRLSIGYDFLAVLYNDRALSSSNCLFRNRARSRHYKGSPYSIAERRVPELIPVLGSQPAGDVGHKPDVRLPLLSAKSAVTPATLKRAATNFAAW